MNVERLVSSQLASTVPLDVEVFICCASFESRCRTVSDRLEPKRFKQVVIARNGA
jgi:hypothetical protein